MLISDSGPFTRVIDAKILTDAESVIKRVFLLQQSDRYRLPSDEISLLNNKDIDRFWQKAFLKHSDYTRVESWDPSHFVLHRQFNENGQYTRFQSLFYCTAVNKFFHPPCPSCGENLQLCQDDNLLTELDLQAYSTSLKRYLFCPKCAQESNPSDFYILGPDAYDPPILKDQLSLINDWGNLIVTAKVSDHFPCMNCSDKRRCYGNENIAASRIAPFSFYPFYLIIAEAGTLNAHDFLSLISGATVDEVQCTLTSKHAPGRAKYLKVAQKKISMSSPYLFELNDEINFLEIFYLKLSFLHELAQIVLAGRDSLSHPGFSFSLERIWVKLTDRVGLLPFYWHFSLDVIDIGINSAKKSYFPKDPPALNLYFLGITWFYALLVNHEQTVEQVQTALKKCLKELASSELQLPELIKKAEYKPTFETRNIFWRPDDRRVKKDWVTLWEKSLNLGADLVMASFSRNTQWSIEDFTTEFDALRKELKTALLGHDFNTHEDMSNSRNQAISAILNEVLAGWRANIKKQKKNKSVEEVEKTLELSSPGTMIFDSQKDYSYENGRPAETVILSPDESGVRQGPLAKPDDPDETLSLSREGQPGPEVNENILQDGEALQETVILGSEDFKSKSPPSGPLKGSDAKNDLPETLILTTGGKAAGNFDLSQQKNFTEYPSETKDISNSENNREKLKQTAKKLKKDALEDEDFFTETVILKSDTAEDKGIDNE